MATKTCTKCLKNRSEDSHQCHEIALKWNPTCNTHKICTKICKCKVQPPQNTPPSPHTQVTNNVCINKSVLGRVGFNTERITVYSGDRSMEVLVTYDSYASHSSISPEVVRELKLKQTFVGMLDIQHFGGNKQEEGFSVTAHISPLVKPIQFLVGECGQSLPSYKYEVPKKWEK